MFDRRSRDDGGDDEGEPFRLVYVARSSAQVARDYRPRLERLSEEGFEVHVLAGPDGGFSELAEGGIHGKPIPVLYRANVAGWVGAFFIVQAYLIEKPAVLVHGHDGLLAWVAAVAAHRAGVPATLATVGDHHFDARTTDLGAASLRYVLPGVVEALEDRIGDVLGRLVGPAAERGRDWLYRHLGQLVDRYVATNERDFDVLEGRELVPSERLEMVIGGRGIDVERFNPDDEELEDRASIRGASGLPESWRFVVGYAGSFEPNREGVDAVRMLDRIASRRRDVGWLFSAEAETEEEPLLADRLRRGRAAVGPSSDDPRYYRAIDLLVHPRTDDESSEVLMKAQAMRVPVVAYDSAPNASVVANRQTGRLVPAGDLDALVEVVEDLIDNPKRARDYGRRARARSAQRFDRENVDRQLLRLYDTVLEEKLPTS